MNFIRKIIREIIENLSIVQNAVLDEERITNKEAAQHVANRENFVASHTYGEDLGDLGLMYVAYSYGEIHPLYVYYKGRWFHNYDDYITPEGEISKWTKKHLEDLRPNNETQGRPTSYLQKLISKFKEKHHLGDNKHTDLEPGEK